MRASFLSLHTANYSIGIVNNEAHTAKLAALFIAHINAMSATCPSMEETALQMAGTAVALLILTISFGHVISSQPLDQLGKRPMGRGLFSYLYNQVNDGVGMWGYDSSLGAWSPLIRVSVHFSCMFWIWALSLLFLGGKEECVSSFTITMYGALVFVLYLTFFYIYFHRLPNVSNPGGPRAHKIQRMPQWNNVTTPFPDIAKNWRCAVAQDSHQVTTSRFEGTAGSLTGEPAGRQIWTNVAVTGSPAKRKRVDERTVQEMASGGRPEGFNASVNPNSADKIFRAQQIRNYMASGKKAPSTSDKPTTVKEAAKKATHFYSMLQTEDGHWAGDYGGPHFLMPGLIVAWYIMGKPERMLNNDQVELMKHYIVTHQQSDGGWGTHIESPSTMFGTTVMYVAIRLLGMEADNEICVRGRAFLQENGGAVMTSSWAKFYLCLLGCMHWDGHNSVPPEMWLLPNWFPFHPGRLWCHCRMVYLPMGYLYGSRFVYDKAETDPLILSLREEVSVW